jgi:ATP phosphoribosyltransferase regulatory subunit
MTDEPPNPALLPSGLRDLLPPDAETEASVVEALMEVFAAHGYQRVKPPLLEF